MVRRLALAAALAATLATPAQSAGLFDTLWSWAASLVQGEAPTPPPSPTPPPTADEDQGYSIDPDG
ncbi:MAG TPA: hypothetical protein VNW71_10240 [Thermoanaerobaculia bacterium]|nr:hypothetical protein [Thermoanaerobaculia bacterium]